jgi:SAM-dependent methyltransferase
MDETVERIAAGYDAVYAALPNSPTFARIWREHALGPAYPAGFEHISFLTLDEMQAMTDALALSPGSTLLDLACGMGGPGLWIARESTANIVGIDISPIALDHARSRAEAIGMSQSARYMPGSFDNTGLDAASIDGALSCDALQYAPDKKAAFAEAARVLRSGARLAFVAFELDPDRLASVPILGDDPVADYGPLLEQAGFDIERYEETPGWRERVTAAYEALAAARPSLLEELSEPATNALLGEITLTLQLRPYRRRVFAVARRLEHEKYDHRTSDRPKHRQPIR